jgi:hypothetical protein
MKLTCRLLGTDEVMWSPTSATVRSPHGEVAAWRRNQAGSVLGHGGSSGPGDIEGRPTSLRRSVWRRRDGFGRSSETVCEGFELQNV